MNFFESFDSFVGQLNNHIAQFFFFNIWPFSQNIKLPFVVALLISISIYSTLRLKFLNFRGLWHAFNIVRGKYDNKNEIGDVSHFQALSTALSATVGLGNIAGVALAISVGGPGATFWMIVAGFLGMSSKLVECTLAQMYREVRPDGKIMGGAMEYLSRGLKELGWIKTGKFLGILFAFFCFGSSLGGGSSFQVSQSYSTIASAVPWFSQHSWLYGSLMALLVGMVILGGINRIAHVASTVVPLMCGAYVVLCLMVLFNFYDKIPQAFAEIFHSAFTPEAGYGGVVGVLVIGFQRAAFSNEAGVGSAAIAHSAAKTKYPAREGFVALLEPLIDTVIVCTMTALVIVITGAYNDPNYAEIRAASQGATLTLKAFSSVFAWSPYLIATAVFLFAYSTIISWYYYGERCFTYLFGEKFCFVYKWFYIFIVFVSASISAGNILVFSDLMLLGMALVNILGLYILFEKVKHEVEKYWQMYKTDKFE